MSVPSPSTESGIERGQERFNIYCAVCHDALGTGNGKIVERGYLRPPNYHTDYSRGFERRGMKVLLRDVPIGYFFEVITRGYGGMPDYASQIPPDDRWKIIAYVRALQLSQWAPLKDLPAERTGQSPARIAAGRIDREPRDHSGDQPGVQPARAELTGGGLGPLRRTALLRRRRRSAPRSCCWASCSG